MPQKPDDSDNMHLDGRSSDVRLKVTREVPLWGVLLVLGGFVVQAVTMYYSVQRAVEELREVRTEVRQIVIDIRRSDVDRERVRMLQEDLLRRLVELEQWRAQRYGGK
jgi:hypothetical protein